MSEDKLRTDIERATRAERLLTDELLREAFVSLKTSYTDAWEATSFRDTDARERLWQAFQIVGKVESHLRSILEDGAVAQKEIEQLQKFGDRRKFFSVV